MLLRPPTLHTTAIVSDDALLAARFSSALAAKGIYIPVLDGPRMTRPDHAAGVTRRNNALARVKAKRVILTGLSDESTAAMAASLPRKCVSLAVEADLPSFASADRVAIEPFRCSSAVVGAGLLQALYEVD